jgi:hypothetical protein
MLWQQFRRVSECAIEVIATTFAWVDRITDSVAKCATTSALVIGL